MKKMFKAIGKKNWGNWDDIMITQRMDSDDINGVQLTLRKIDNLDDHALITSITYDWCRGCVTDRFVTVTKHDFNTLQEKVVLNESASTIGGLNTKIKWRDVKKEITIIEADLQNTISTISHKEW